MATLSPEEKKQRLLQRKEKLERELKRLDAAEKQAARKRDAHEKIQLGGLVRIVFPFGTEVDKGLLLGYLMELPALIELEPEKAAQWKQTGDKELLARSQANTRRRNAI